MIRSLGYVVRRREDILNSTGGLKDSIAKVNFERLRKSFQRS